MPNAFGMKNVFEQKGIGTEGARLLREKRVQGRPRRRKSAEEAPGPPAESECLEWKSTYQIPFSTSYPLILLQKVHTHACIYIKMNFSWIPQFIGMVVLDSRLTVPDK